MEKSPFGNAPFTREFLDEEVFGRINEDRHRAYAKYLEDRVANPHDFKPDAMRFIGKIFDASAYWFHFVFDKADKPEETYELLLDSFVENIAKINNEITENWSAAHGVTEFRESVAAYLQARKFHWKAEHMARLRALRAIDASPKQGDFERTILDAEAALERSRRILAIPISPAQPPPPLSGQDADLIQDQPVPSRRLKALADYKVKAGNPSNRRIYEAMNSGINKPEFYQWLRGNLADTSKTTKNFENFLHKGKPPIPKKPNR